MSIARLAGSVKAERVCEPPHRTYTGGMTDANADAAGVDEAALVLRARTERAAFSELYERYAPRIFAYLYYRTNSTQDAEDLTARVFVRALRHIGEYEPRGGGFGAWLFAIAHNLLVNWYRDRGRRPQQALDSARPIAAEGDAHAAVERAEEAEAVRRAVATLSPERQQLIFLKYAEGRANREIGRVLGKSEGAVKSALVRTLAALRREMERGDRTAR